MISPALLHAALCLRAGPALAWDTCRSLLRAHVPRRRDVVAVIDPAGFLARRLVEAVDADRLFLHARDAALAVSEGDWDVAPLRRPWPAFAAPQPQRLRRLDTLYADSHDVGLMVFDDLADRAALAGARRLLDSHRPVVLLDFMTVPPARRAAAAEATRAALPGFAWHDSFLLKLAGAANVVGAIAAAETVFALFPPGTSEPAGQPVATDADDPLLAALAWRGWTWPVRPEGLRRLALLPDAALVTAGFHAPETDGHTVWRWSGPERAASLWLPVPSYGVYNVALDVFAWGVLEGAADIRLAVQGGPLAAARIEAGRLWLGPVEVWPSGQAAAVRVNLVCRRMRPGTPKDPRRLGLCLSLCTLERED